MRIAVDALGGDQAPGEVVAGALAAARRLPGDEFFLVGDRAAVRKSLGEDIPPNVAFRESSGVVGMDEEPAGALRARPDASVAVAARMVRSGEADALFSAGNTGATVAAALLRIGRLRSARRPAIATMLPFAHPVLLMDAGATVQCRPQDLANFGILGGVFARGYLSIEGTPRVGLLNIGEEPGKGTDLTKEAYPLMGGAASGVYKFVGNVEGRDLGTGAADVVVTDGFTGNMALKTAEGTSQGIFDLLRPAMTATLPARLAAAVLRPRLREVRDRLDPERYGGSFLLGVRGTVVIGHGNFRARGVENSLRVISETGPGLPETLEEALAQQGGGES